jgi:hypothetical protein
MNLFQILIQALKSRILPIVTRAKLFLSPNYLKARLTEGLRSFFTNILNVRPRDKHDYYPIGRWLVSKRLAFAAVLVIGVLSLVYIMSSWSALFPGRANDGIKTYSYNNVLLKFAKGTVRIKGKSGYLAYEGEVSNASCNGVGELRNPAGYVVYQGNFALSMYEGEGTQYYDDGSLHYQGAFHENLYNGEGKLYRPNGSLEYEGNFAFNKKEGYGTLYDFGHNPIFTGEFTMDDIKYSDLLEKKASDLAVAYTGDVTLYETSSERVRYMPDISAMTVEYLDPDSIDEEASVEGIYVLKDSFTTADEPAKDFNTLTELLGEPVYVGRSYGTFPELLAILKLNEQSEGAVMSGEPDMSISSVFSEYMEVSDYDTQYSVYLHTYHKDGLSYTFVSDQGMNTFYFYFIQAEDLSDVE